MTRQVKALGSSPRPLLLPAPPLLLLLLLLLLQRTGDIEKSIRLGRREKKDWRFLNVWVKSGEGWWIGEVAQPGVDCCHLGRRLGQEKVWIGSGFGITWVRKVLRAYAHGEDKNSAINTWRDYGGR